MVVKQVARFLLSVLNEYMYTDWTRSVMQTFGLDTRLLKLYRKAEYFCSDSTKAHTIAGVTAEFRIDTYQEFKRFRNFGVEADVLANVLVELEPGDVFYDVGANVGTYSCFAACRHPSITVVSIEPHPINVKTLRRNLELNGVDAIIRECALSDTSGTAELRVEENVSGAGEHTLAVRDEQNTISVDLTTGEALVRETKTPSPDVVKIDVEGAEYRVLSGLEDVLADDGCRLCYVEVHPDRLNSFDTTVDDFHRLFSDAGYRVERIAEREIEYYLKAKKAG